MENTIPQTPPQKQCNACHLWLPFSDFPLSRAEIGGLGYKCNKCATAYTRKTKNPKKERDKKLRAAYGITSKQYDRMLADQGGVCAICKRHETYRNGKARGGIRPLAVDHDHKTGEARALLCHKCNSALAYMDEDPERISAMADYAAWCQTREPSKIVQLRLVE